MPYCEEEIKIILLDFLLYYQNYYINNKKYKIRKNKPAKVSEEYFLNCMKILLVMGVVLLLLKLAAEMLIYIQTVHFCIINKTIIISCLQEINILNLVKRNSS